MSVDDYENFTIDSHFYDFFIYIAVSKFIPFQFIFFDVAMIALRLNTKSIR